MARTYRRSTRLAVLVAAAAIGLAACGSGATTPQVASLGTHGDGSGTSPATGSSTAPKGSPAQLLDEWAACIRRHGDPSQADPVIDANKVIQITTPAGPDAQQLGQEASNGIGPCGSYVLAASRDLRGNQPAPPPLSMAQQLKYAQCMRAHGVPKFPDPNGSGGTNIGNLDPTGPVFQNADKLCSAETGGPAPGAPPPPGTIQVQSGGTSNPNVQPSGANG
jgi:hypothetical protein